MVRLMLRVEYVVKPGEKLDESKPVPYLNRGECGKWYYDGSSVGFGGESKEVEHVFWYMNDEPGDDVEAAFKEMEDFLIPGWTDLANDGQFIYLRFIKSVVDDNDSGSDRTVNLVPSPNQAEAV